ncbi:MAG: DUF1989 domain-containing protein [Pseudomonadota bacterium]
MGWNQSPQTAKSYELKSGDILRVSGLTGPVFALVLDRDGRPDQSLLGLSASDRGPTSGFDPRELNATLAAQNIGADTAWSVLAPGEDDTLILRARNACTLWLVLAVPDAAVVDGSGMGALRVERQPSDASALRLPEPLGEVRDEFTVMRGSAQSYELEPGEAVQIIDIEGQQCSDFMAFSKQALDAGQPGLIDSTATRSMVRRAYPGPGLLDKFFDAEMRPMLRVMQDTCGRHDTFGLACTARGYEDRGFPGHLNCSDNISAAVARFGIARRNAWPAINFFWSTWIDPDGHHIQSEESWSRPGDFVTMQAIEPLVCVSTACPDDIDPINGWNPTDIHIRIYRKDTPIRRAVAYREKEDAAMSLSQESAFHPSTSQLTQDFGSARNLWLPNSYPSHGTLGEYWACREKVTLQDMSSLRKYDLVGPDAEALLNLAMTKNVAKIAQWRGAYALMCDEQGQVIDDGTLFRLAPHLFRWCCGTEESARHLTTLAQENKLDVRVNAMDDALPNLSLQGPKSRDLLREIVFTQPHVPGLDDLKWFGATVARLQHREGIPFMLSRTGYTGELGFELFCGAKDAPALWDAVMEVGQRYGIVPMGGTALEILRIEAGFAASGAEFAPGVDAFEAGLGFAVNLKKGTFVGKTALNRNAQSPRKVLKGLILDQDDVPAHGAPVFAGERPVGVVTSATRSPMLERAVAMARLAVEHSDDGTCLQIGQLDGHFKRLSCTVGQIPFVDPTRSRARA